MNLTTRELDLKLKLNEYERLDGNIKEKLWKHAKILFVFSKKHDNVILFQKLKYILDNVRQIIETRKLLFYS